MRVPAICTTSWDDGHPLDLRVAELLAKYELTGTFYIPFENSREVMTSRQIRQLVGSFELGSHTVHHAVLTEVTDELANAEIFDSKKQLEDMTGILCESFCFPKGRFHRRHLEMVSQAGYRCARTVELLSIGFSTPRLGVYLMPTTVQVADHSWTAYGKNCTKRLSARNLANLVFHARSRNWAATARSLLYAVAQHGGVFHLWGHSWEIDAHHQWLQFESVLREMHRLRCEVPCKTNSAIAAQPRLGLVHTAPAGAGN